MQRSVWRSATTLLALAATACTQWRLSRGPSPTAVPRASDHGHAIRVELNSGELIVIAKPAVERDSIFGTAHRRNEPGPTQVAIATADVRRVEFGTISFGKFLAAWATAVLAFYAIVMTACATAGLAGA